MTEHSTEVNPFETPRSGDSLTTPDTTVQIRGQIAEHDYSRALRNKRAIVVFVVCGVLMIFVSRILMRPVSAVVPPLVLAGVFLFFAFRHWRTGPRYLKRVGGSLGPIQGTLNSQTLCTEFKGKQSHRAMKHLTHIKITDEAAVLSFDVPLIRFTVLPFRLFDDPSAARAILSLAAKKADKSSFEVFDQRVTIEPAKEIDRPSASAIPYSGAIRLSDLEKVGGSNTFWAWMKVFLMLNILPCSFAIYVFSTGANTMMIALLAFVFSLMNFRLLKAAIQMGRKNPEEVVLRSAGWVDDDALHSSTNIGESVTEWSFFTAAKIGPDIVGLELPGSAKLHSVLARRQFSSDEDWQSALQLVKSNNPNFCEI